MSGLFRNMNVTVFEKSRVKAVETLVRHFLLGGPLPSDTNEIRDFLESLLPQRFSSARVSTRASACLLLLEASITYLSTTYHFVLRADLTEMPKFLDAEDALESLVARTRLELGV